LTTSDNRQLVNYHMTSFFLKLNGTIMLLLLQQQTFFNNFEVKSCSVL